jgi:hypothetical protein
MTGVEDRRGVTTADAAPAHAPDELESALDEVITHLRDELDHGTWPSATPDQR